MLTAWPAFFPRRLYLVASSRFVGFVARVATDPLGDLVIDESTRQQKQDHAGVRATRSVLRKHCRTTSLPRPVLDLDFQPNQFPTVPKEFRQTINASPHPSSLRPFLTQLAKKRTLSACQNQELKR